MFQSVEIDLSDETLTRQIVESADEHVQFIGTFSPVELPIGDKSNLFLGADNTLHWPQTDNYAIRSFRAYFHVDGGSVSAIKLYFGEDETTGVENIANSQKLTANGEYYDLQGRRVANGQKPKAKGIYIYKGKKQVIK